MWKTYYKINCAILDLNIKSLYHCQKEVDVPFKYIEANTHCKHKKNHNISRNHNTYTQSSHLDQGGVNTRKYCSQHTKLLLDQYYGMPSPIASTTNITKHSTTLTTGCKLDTNIQHLDDETNILPLHIHSKLHVSQIRQKSQHSTTHSTLLNAQNIQTKGPTTINTPLTSKHTAINTYLSRLNTSEATLTKTQCHTFAQPRTYKSPFLLPYTVGASYNPVPFVTHTSLSEYLVQR